MSKLMAAIKQIKLRKELSVKLLTLILKNQTKSLNIPRATRGFVTTMIQWAQHIVQSPYIKSAEYQPSIFGWLYGVTGIISELIFSYQSLSAERDIDGSTQYLFWKSWLFITSERRQGSGKGRVCGRMCKVDLTHSGKHDCVQERILVYWEKQKCLKCCLYK